MTGTRRGGNHKDLIMKMMRMRMVMVIRITRTVRWPNETSLERGVPSSFIELGHWHKEGWHWKAQT